MKKTLLISLCFFAFCLITKAQDNDDNLQTGTETNLNKPIHEKISYKNTRLTIGAGYAYQLAEFFSTGDSKLDDFYSRMKHGFNIDIDGQLFLSERMGVGLNIFYIQRSNSSEHLHRQSPNYKLTDRFLYIGPTWALRYKINRWEIYANLSLGPLFYNSKERTTGASSNYDKVLFSLYQSISGEYKYSSQTAIGLKLSMNESPTFIEEMLNRVGYSHFMMTAFISFSSK